ncbi:MAG: hypothetical protein WC943_13885, partial [Elusimicrobiota bacterium]
MTRFHRSPAFLGLTALLAPALAWAVPVVKTELDRETIPGDETAVLTITVPSDCEVEKPFGETFEVVTFDSQLMSGPASGKKLQPLRSKYSMGTSVQVLGSGSAESKTWQRRFTFEIHPLLPGKIRLPALKVSCPDGKTKSAAKTLTATEVKKSGSGEPAASGDGDSFLYKPVSLGNTAPDKPRTAAAPPAPGPIIAQETPPPPAQPPAPSPSPATAESQPAAPGPAPEAVAAQHADKVARYVQGFAKGMAGMVHGKDEKLSSAGKDLASASRTMGSIIKTVFLVLVSLAGAAATGYGLYIGAAAFRKSRHYERLRLWVLAQISPPQKEENVVGFKYRVLTELGQGGMGTVLLAEDIKLGRKVALKRLHSEA